jgi:hypothetical protein
MTSWCVVVGGVDRAAARQNHYYVGVSCDHRVIGGDETQHFRGFIEVQYHDAVTA